jgi:hypothetical protein
VYAPILFFPSLLHQILSIDPLLLFPWKFPGEFLFSEFERKHFQSAVMGNPSGSIFGLKDPGFALNSTLNPVT